MDLFLFVFMCVIFEFCDTEEVWTYCLSWALQGILGSQKAQMQEHMKRGHTGRKGIHGEEREIKTSPGRMSCCSEYPWKSLQCPSLSEHFLHIYRKESNHPFHFILTTSKLCPPDYLHDHPFHLPKNKMPTNYTKVKLAWWKQTALLCTRVPGASEEGRNSLRLSSQCSLSWGRELLCNPPLAWLPGIWEAKETLPMWLSRGPFLKTFF